MSSTSNDGPYFNLDDLDKLVKKLEYGWKIDFTSRSRIVLIQNSDIRIFVSMTIGSPNQ